MTSIFNPEIEGDSNSYDLPRKGIKRHDIDPREVTERGILLLLNGHEKDPLVEAAVRRIDPDYFERMRN
ncbi:hypothetical protein CMI48_00900 [Candidatus Pacearchaeota archaeon]|jgi:hypothetical protein|nr:hypothetical protein [Candidatus Pacearchaeota archaeon]|tara:strand:+ start:498 stop:704 length:207 start_codon:yes stop_codon:yes gene_type:complete